MSFSAPRTRRRPTITLHPRVRGVGVGVLLAVLLVATTPDRPVAIDAPVRAQVADSPAPTATAPVEPAPVGPDRVPFRLHREAASAADVVRAATAAPVGEAAPAAPVGDRATLPRSEPARVRIPAIGVDSEIIGLGLQGDGRMEVPPGAFPAGWYTGAPTPGELGPAVLAGHVDYGGSAGVFARLRDLRAGDMVEVAREDGSTATFRVTSVEQHPKDAFPTAAVYGDIDHAGLRLITCGGSFDRRVHSYEDNIVVFAELTASAEPRA